MRLDLDFGKILVILWSKLWVMILAVLLFAAGFFVVSAYVIPPMYTAEASMYVYNETRRVEEVTSIDLTTSQQLVQTYVVILTSNTVLDQVSAQLGGVYTSEELREMLSASAINNTEAFRIRVTHPDPTTAQLVANTIADVAPTEIIRVVKAGSVEVIDHARLPDEPSSPNVIRNTILGALLGLILTAVVLVIQAMLDTAVHSEEDLLQNFNLPVLGIIPTLGESEGSHKKKRTTYDNYYDGGGLG